MTFSHFTAKGWLRTAKTLTEALPYLQRYNNKKIIIKYGGHAMIDQKRSIEFSQDITLLKQCNLNPIVVHGGGPQIATMLDRLNIKSEFINGLRVTDAKTMEVVQMVLAGTINKDIVRMINTAGGHAVGLCGKDANLITAKQYAKENIGFVGEPVSINTQILDIFHGTDMIPVIAPLGADKNSVAYNINADTASGALAGAVQADRLLLLTDVEGVKNKDGDLIPDLSLSEAKALIKDGTITEGMIPKIETCIYAVEQGVKGVVILDGRVPHAVLLELFTAHGAGTLVYKD